VFREKKEPLERRIGALWKRAGGDEDISSGFCANGYRGWPRPAADRRLTPAQSPPHGRLPGTVAAMVTGLGPARTPGTKRTRPWVMLGPKPRPNPAEGGSVGSASTAGYREVPARCAGKDCNPPPARAPFAWAAPIGSEGLAFPDQGGRVFERSVGLGAMGRSPTRENARSGLRAPARVTAPGAPGHLEGRNLGAGVWRRLLAREPTGHRVWGAGATGPLTMCRIPLVKVRLGNGMDPRRAPAWGTTHSRSGPGVATRRCRMPGVQQRQRRRECAAGCPQGGGGAARMRPARPSRGAQPAGNALP